LREIKKKEEISGENGEQMPQLRLSNISIPLENESKNEISKQPQLYDKLV